VTPAALAGAAEASVVALAATGDNPAFAELVRRRQGMVRGMMRRLCGDGAFAEDLAQQAFVQAWRQLGKLESPQAFGAWLRRIAVNVWLQEARKSSVRFETAEAEPYESRAHGLEPDGPPPGDLAAARLDLSRALLRLKEHERVCVVLAYAEGLSHSEIAEATGWPLGTVKSNVSRGAERLRAWLSPQDEYDERRA
jgi:RNA polymerase sigma-70 factor (ECF subfamily)